MLAEFCIRLAFGLIGSLLLLWQFELNPRFFRAHFLTAVGLLAGAWILLADQRFSAGGILLLTGLFFSIVGSIAWSIDALPLGRFWSIPVTASAAAALVTSSLGGKLSAAMALAQAFTSAGLLGTATTAMLLGHSYLLAPSMSIAPLKRMVTVTGVLLAARMMVGVWGLASLGRGGTSLDSIATLWLAARWVVGLFIPAILLWMSWETTRIRSTQSATGILYVVVICCFLGELIDESIWHSELFSWR